MLPGPGTQDTHSLIEVRPFPEIEAVFPPSGTDRIGIEEVHFHHHIPNNVRASERFKKTAFSVMYDRAAGCSVEAHNGHR